MATVYKFLIAIITERKGRKKSRDKECSMLAKAHVE